jgi:hypothetical protein
VPRQMANSLTNEKRIDTTSGGDVPAGVAIALDGRTVNVANPR